MAQPGSFGSVKVDVATTFGQSEGSPDPGTPFRILVLGDFSGRSNRAVVEVGSALAARRPVQIDRDNLEDVIARLSVQLSLGSIGPEQRPVTLQFKSLDDFHPDQIYGQLDVFRALRETRQRLANPKTFAAAAAEVRAWSKIESTPAREPVTTPEPNPLSIENLFDQTVLETQGRDRDRQTGEVNWNAMLREIVEPYSIPGSDPQLPELLGCVDAASAQILRTILHHRDFQCIEAAWRAVSFLIRRVETDAELKLYVLDISKYELTADLCASDELSASGLYKLVVGQTVGTPGAPPWSMLIGNYAFCATRDDAELLGRICKIAAQANAPFVAAAGPSLIGCRSLADTPDPDDWQSTPDSTTTAVWESLRALPEAGYAGLVIPRFLLRLPYGRKTDPAERFPFEELSDEPDHESYLWGNPAIVCGCLVAQSFRRDGWGMRIGSAYELDGLPVHVYSKHGESNVTPCGEAVLSMRALERIANRGLMPLAGIQSRDTVRLCSFQSIATPSRVIQGRWS